MHSELKEPLFFEEVFKCVWYNFFFKAMVILGSFLIDVITMSNLNLNHCFRSEIRENAIKQTI